MHRTEPQKETAAGQAAVNRGMRQHTKVLGAIVSRIGAAINNEAADRIFWIGLGVNLGGAGLLGLFTMWMGAR